MTSTLPSASMVAEPQTRLGPAPGPGMAVTVGAGPLMSTTIAVPSSAISRILPRSNMAHGMSQLTNFGSVPTRVMRPAAVSMLSSWSQLATITWPLGASVARG